MASVKLRVLCGESVVEYGTRETRWWLHHDNRWIRVDQVPNVRQEVVSAGPGTIWHKLFEFAADVGAWLMRVDTEPLPERLTDPLSYLERERRGSRQRQRRRFYQVARDGGLTPRQRELAPE